MTPAFDLDDLDAIKELDSEGVLASVEALGEQCRRAWEIGAGATALPSATGIDSIVVLGMGGSGVSGDATQVVVEPRLPIPFRVIKSYGPLPEWVGRNTLVFAVSYSGGTEETIAALEEAHDRGTRTVTVSSGGPLAEMADRWGLAHVQIPSGQQPRASLGYLTLPILAVLSQMGLVPDAAPDVDESVKVLGSLAERCDRKVPRWENPAKDLAARLAPRIPVIYGGHGLGATAAMRFKCDLNEYGKIPALWNVFPELNHNELAGWKVHEDLTRSHFALVLLRDAGEHPRIALRFDITKRLIRQSFADVIEVQSEGDSVLARLLSLVMVTQLAAIYVGFAHGVDPGPVETIQRLKAELSAADAVSPSPGE